MNLSSLSVVAFRCSDLYPILPADMPVSSSYPPIDVPDVDVWDFLFDRKTRQFPDDKSKPVPPSP